MTGQSATSLANCSMRSSVSLRSSLSKPIIRCLRPRSPYAATSSAIRPAEPVNGNRPPSGRGNSVPSRYQGINMAVSMSPGLRSRGLGVAMHVCQRPGKQRRGVQQGARVARNRIPPVAQASRAAPGRRALAADPDGEFRRRFGRESHSCKAHKLAVHGRIILRPQRPEGADVFIRRRTPAVEGRRPQNGQFLGHPADPDAQRQPTLGQHVQGGQHLGGQYRRAVHQHHHRGEQPDDARWRPRPTSTP